MLLPRIRAAAAHLAPVWLDAAATAAKAEDAIAEAACGGAGLVVFPQGLPARLPRLDGACRAHPHA
jgi:aliphatic nitrilase